jgi:hypothetical protein
MRTAFLLLIGTALLSNGCAALIARSGKDLEAMTTREEVRKDMGVADEIGMVNGEPYEEFRFHGKVADFWKAHSNGMGFVMTFGLGEVVQFPEAVFEAGQEVIDGHAVRFYYDPIGNVTGCVLDGKPLTPCLFFRGRKRANQPPPATTEEGPEREEQGK